MEVVLLLRLMWLLHPLFSLTGHLGLGRLPAAGRQPICLPGEEERQDQNVRPPVLQGVAHLEGGGREDQVPV